MRNARNVSWVEGWTQARRFRLNIDGEYPDLTGRDFELVLKDADGVEVPSPGTVTVVDPQTGDDLGAIEFTPTDETILTAARSPLRAHFVEDTGSGLRFWPNVAKGGAMFWYVAAQAGS